MRSEYLRAPFSAPAMEDEPSVIENILSYAKGEPAPEPDKVANIESKVDHIGGRVETLEASVETLEATVSDQQAAAQPPPDPPRAEEGSEPLAIAEWM